MSSTITFRDKALAHLNHYNHIRQDIEFGAPFEITQDGIAMSLGISRSHASIVIGKMEDALEVVNSLSTVRNSTKATRRRVYHLTDLGKKLYRQRVDELSEMGLDLELSIDRHCMSEHEFRMLPAYQSEMMGCFCVLRKTANRDNFPRDIPHIMFKNNGSAYMKDYQKERIISYGTPKDRLRWHSRAADWCIDSGEDITERLYHLDLAHRDREAIRIIRGSGYRFMDSADRTIAEIIHSLLSRQECPDLLRIVSRIHLDRGELIEAEYAISRLRCYNPVSSRALASELLLRDNRRAEALKNVLEDYRPGPETDLAVALCLKANGHLEESIGYFERSKAGMMENGCIFRMDVLLMNEALAYASLGRMDDAEATIGMAVSVCRDEKKRTALRKLRRDILGSEDGVLLEGVNIGDVKIPDILDIPLEHGEPLETKSPCEDRGLDTERGKDLGPEHSGSSELHPLAVEEDLYLKRGLGVGEVRGTDADLIESHLGVELLDHRDEHVEICVLVDDDTLDLSELGKVGRIDGLVPEDPRDGECLLGCVRVGGDVPDAGDGAVRPQDGRLRHLPGPCSAPSRGSCVPSVLMDIPDLLQELLVVDMDRCGVLQVECILKVPCRVVLRRVQHIQVPERGLDVL